MVILFYFSSLECVSQCDCRAALSEGHYRKRLCNRLDSRLTLQTQKTMPTVLVLLLHCNFSFFLNMLDVLVKKLSLLLPGAS